MNTIACAICGEQIHAVQLHLKKAHPEVTLEQYQAQFPGQPIFSPEAQARIDAQQKKVAEAAQEPLVMAHAQMATVTPLTPSTPTTAPASRKEEMTTLFQLKQPLLNGRGQPLEINVLNPVPELEPYIPAVDEGHVWDNEILRSMAMALELNMPLYLYGHKGTGKTTNFQQLAARTRRPMLRVQHTIGTEEAHILGQYTIQNGQTVFELGPLALAMKHGWIYLADEYDFGLSAVLAVYQPVLEGAPLVIKEAPLKDRVIKPHPNFRFWANGNTNGAGDDSGLYSGTSVQNSANYDRFGIMLKVDYMPAEQEAEILTNRTNLAKKEANKLVDLAGKIRTEFEAKRISDTISTRALVRIAMIGMMRADMMLGLKLCFTNKLTAVDRATVEGVAQRIYG